MQKLCYLIYCEDDGTIKTDNLVWISEKRCINEGNLNDEKSIFMSVACNVDSNVCSINC